ncbi:OmpA family protein [Taibaiella lutea]|uniref:OmpA family protein n=1 Tax=Taibaiella lutea TaxID=2608001 RepID=A0A5M6CH56_9BACT|nr:OmpA family protein [Taibaiella lutea]KAA5534531.1 OmpA family protein [Taibaiella lutea]
MAHLEVTPKKSSPVWLWILLALVALAIIYFLVMRSDNKTEPVATTDTTTAAPPANKEVLAATEPDWDRVDFNSANSTDPDITDKDITVSGNDDYTIYSLGENILFATDQSAVQGNAEAKLKQISASLDKKYKGAYIGVYGNTDAVGTAADNKQLGAERAAAVKDWLVNSGGVENSKVSVHSLGEKEPVATNATASGRQQNRNVKIVAFRIKQ